MPTEKNFAQPTSSQLAELILIMAEQRTVPPRRFRGINEGLFILRAQQIWARACEARERNLAANSPIEIDCRPSVFDLVDFHVPEPGESGDELTPEQVLQLRKAAAEIEAIPLHEAKFIFHCSDFSVFEISKAAARLAPVPVEGSFEADFNVTVGIAAALNLFAEVAKCSEEYLWPSDEFPKPPDGFPAKVIEFASGVSTYCKAQATKVLKEHLGEIGRPELYSKWRREGVSEHDWIAYGPDFQRWSIGRKHRNKAEAGRKGAAATHRNTEKRV